MSTQPFQDIEKHKIFIPHLFWLSFHMVQKLPYVFFFLQQQQKNLQILSILRCQSKKLHVTAV